jgi:hypothetical protein
VTRYRSPENPLLFRRFVDDGRPRTRWYKRRSACTQYLIKKKGNVRKHNTKPLSSLCVRRRVGMYVCSLTYPACKAHAPYYMWPLWLHHIFRHYLINGAIFGKKLLNIKCVFIFSATFVWNLSLCKKNSARHCRKCKNVFVKSTRYSCQIWIKLEFSRWISGKKRA